MATKVDILNDTNNNELMNYAEGMMKTLRADADGENFV